MKSEQFEKDKTLLLRQLLLTVLALVIIAATASLAWYYNASKVVIAAKIRKPEELHLSAGHNDDISKLSLGGIDVTKTDNSGKYQKQYVFSVEGRAISQFYLELAYTTNIPFTYSIQWAEESTTVPAGTSVVYKADDGTLFYYKPLSRIAENKTTIQGSFLNKATTGNYANKDAVISGKSVHQRSFLDYDTSYVQKNAEPLYWKSNVISVNDYQTYYNQAGLNRFKFYYILTVSWKPEELFENAKETDLFYIIVGTNEER